MFPPAPLMGGPPLMSNQPTPLSVLMMRPPPGLRPPPPGWTPPHGYPLLPNMPGYTVPGAPIQEPVM